MDEFKESVPEIAKGLAEKMAGAHETNKKFQAAFDSFFTLYRQWLNPNISASSIGQDRPIPCQHELGLRQE